MKKFLLLVLFIVITVLIGGCEKQKEYTITFITNCDINNEEIIIISGDKINPPKEITKKDYIFLGWYYNGKLWDFDEDIPTSNITLEAKWISNNTSITIEGPNRISLDESYTYTVVAENIDEEFEMEWTSEDETIAKIESKTGTIQPIKEGEVFINVKIKTVPSIIAYKRLVIVKSHQNYQNIDLQGYTIKIASGVPQIIDPFNPDYKGYDKEAKQKAWKEVEEQFNCKIVVEEYPVQAELGPSRWNYILTQAINKKSDYDFLYVPDTKIKKFVDGDALLSLEDYNNWYYNNKMNKEHIKSGTINNELYTITDKTNEFGLTLLYNYDLYNELKKYNQNLKEPSEIFLNKDWISKNFELYCEEVQKTMKKAYGSKGDNTSQDQEYYAICCLLGYLWTGLSSNDGTPILDNNTLELILTNDEDKKNAELVKKLYINNLIGYNKGLEAFDEGKALFTVVDLSLDNQYINNSFNYCYVPFPSSTVSNFKPVVTSVNQYVMPIGRNYDGFGNECNSENIYFALSTLFSLTNKYLENNNNNYNYYNNFKNNYCHSDFSKQSFEYINEMIKNGNYYYDYFSTPSNNFDDYGLVSFYPRPNITRALAKYINSDEITWEESLAQVIPIFREILRITYENQ